MKDTFERLCEGIRRAERTLWPDIQRNYGRRAGKRHSQMRERLVLAGATEPDLDEVDRLARETPLDWYEVAERALYAIALRAPPLPDEAKQAAFARLTKESKRVAFGQARGSRSCQAIAETLADAYYQRPSPRRTVMVDGSAIELTGGQMGALLGCADIQEPEFMTVELWDELVERFEAACAAAPYTYSIPLPLRGLAALGCGLASDPLAGIGPAGGR